jgi:hypothetical protein
MLAPTSSLAAPESDDDGRATAKLRLVRLRSQLAVVRALVDQVEHLARRGNAKGLGDQLSEEIGRLGQLLLESATSLTESQVLMTAESSRDTRRQTARTYPSNPSPNEGLSRRNAHT